MSAIAQTRAARRELGSIYTPREIAREMVYACLDQWFREPAEGSAASPQAERVCRVLDPACGDGAFLLEVFEELSRRSARSANERAASESSAERALQIAREQIFGVDIDPSAVAVLKSTLLERLCASGCRSSDATAALEANIRCGNSLTGGDFNVDPDHVAKRDASSDDRGLDSSSPAIDWPPDFPIAATAGGFDIIIGNPPYLREKDAKALFDSLAQSELGRRWREARMDLWHYFVHRSLDLLRPGGILAFVVSSYWTSSRGARRLIARLERETRLDEIVLFDNAPIFSGISGRHMTFRLRKAGVADRTPIQPGEHPESSRSGCRVVTASRARMSYVVPHAELFRHGRLVIAPPDPAQSHLRDRPTLGEFFGTRQGIAENPPVINRRLHRDLGGAIPLGTGVFVLREEEVDELNLLPRERSVLRPYYDTSAVKRYQLPTKPTHQLLYLARQTAPNLDPFPNIAAHLQRVRPILERRRETREGSCQWWQLHWPREERIFTEPRILSVQMGARPQFVFAERPTFVGFSINLILARGGNSVSLEVLTGILNSRFAANWFERHAKRRGKNLEINAHVLRDFPLPRRDPAIEGRISELVLRRQAAPEDAKQAGRLEEELDELVCRLYSERL